MATTTSRTFLLPDLGEGLTEATVADWRVAVGDTVEVDQVVAEVETAKAVVEVPCPYAGVVTELHADVGEEVEVGTPLVTVGEPGSSPSESSSTTESDHATTDMVPSPGSARDGDAAGRIPPEASDAGASGSVLVGYGTGGGGRGRRRRSSASTTAGPVGRTATDQPTQRPLAKPPVRKLAKDLGVDLVAVTPTGAGGVVTREDVHAHAERPTAAPPADREPPGREPHVERAPDAVRRVPLSGVRKAIAERMSTSRREIPEATTWVDCDATALMAVRAELNALRDDVRVSPLALILRACVAGLRRHPELNASLDTSAGEIVQHQAIHLGVATQTDRGLLVPVIRDAHRRSTLDIAAELTRLAAAARDASLPPAELTGSTFSVTNYGTFGVDGGNPVINHPEAAILGVGRIAERPWVVDGEVAVRSVLQLCVAFDHRIADGGEAAGFLRFVADCVESPTLLLAHV